MTWAVMSTSSNRRIAILLSASSSAHKRSHLGSASPHDVLGVTPSAPFGEVKERFQALAHFYHPDMPNGDPNKFRDINAAYRTLRALEREKRVKNADTHGFWAERSRKVREKTRSHADDHANPRGPDEREGASVLREAMWMYEAYELAIILGAGVAVLVIALDRYVLVQRMTREKRARHRAMDEGLPPSMPMALDAELVRQFSEPVSQEELAVDEAIVREDAYYRRATQRRFEDFREFMFIFDPDGVTSRKVTTSRFSVHYVDENLIPKRCAVVREFNSEEKGSRYMDISKDVTETLQSTPWESTDAQYIAPVVARGLASIPMNSPDTAKWTFIEYQTTDKQNTFHSPVCLMALRNYRYKSLGMCQRVTVTGNSTLSPKYAAKREEELEAGTISKRKLVRGGNLPVKDLSIPLERMKL